MILVSACLLGVNCKYNGANNWCPRLLKTLEKIPVMPFCPEKLGGLPVPRRPCEITGGQGADVIAGKAEVIDKEGQNVTGNFLLGAERSLELAEKHRISTALLKNLSPSCGTGRIYDGSFKSRLISGTGVTAALLKSRGIRVFNEDNFLQTGGTCL
ncbi:MAG: DUF523 domain-containing protein [Syntrophomonadaceae bacterium]|nr:DUF523 domain-containing protein [Syntrophomonadaceae bacterium]